MRGAACRDKRNTGVKNPWKELPGERKEEEGIYCVATAASASVSEGREIHLVDYDRWILVSIPCAPVSTKLREWFSSFTGIPWSITRPRWKRPLSKSGASSKQQIALSSRTIGGGGAPVQGRFYSTVRDFKSPLETGERPNSLLSSVVLSPRPIRGIFPRAPIVPVSMKFAADGNSDGSSVVGKFRHRIGREPSSPATCTPRYTCVHEPETVYSITSAFFS